MIVGYLKIHPLGSAEEMSIVFGRTVEVMKLCLEKLDREGLIELELESGGEVQRKKPCRQVETERNYTRLGTPKPDSKSKGDGK